MFVAQFPSLLSAANATIANPLEQDESDKHLQNCEAPSDFAQVRDTWHSQSAQDARLELRSRNRSNNVHKETTGALSQARM